MTNLPGNVERVLPCHVCDAGVLLIGAYSDTDGLKPFRLPFKDPYNHKNYLCIDGAYPAAADPDELVGKVVSAVLIPNCDI